MNRSPHFIADLQYFTPEQGGRKTPAFSGYRPHIKFGFSEMMTSGQQKFIDKEKVFPGEKVRAEITIMSIDFFKNKLTVGLNFNFREGPHIIGTGIITEILYEDLKAVNFEMEIKKYKYSPTPMLFSLVKIGISSILLYKVITLLPAANNWLYMGCGILIIVAWLINLLLKIGIPLFKGKEALELDDEKLQYFVKEWVKLQYSREVIYWKDVKDIEYSSLPRVGPLITFRITDGGDDASIYPKYIAWNNDDLYKTIQEYFKNSKV
jgi:hypothetical protein